MELTIHWSIADSGNKKRSLYRESHDYTLHLEKGRCVALISLIHNSIKDLNVEQPII